MIVWLMIIWLVVLTGLLVSIMLAEHHNFRSRVTDQKENVRTLTKVVESIEALSKRINNLEREFKKNVLTSIENGIGKGARGK